MRKAALKTILEKQKPREETGVSGAAGNTKAVREKNVYREFFLILDPASFSIAAVSTLFSVTSL
jgi:hypothetical protein